MWAVANSAPWCFFDVISVVQAEIAASPGALYHAAKSSAGAAAAPPGAATKTAATHRAREDAATVMDNGCTALKAGTHKVRHTAVRMASLPSRQNLPKMVGYGQSARLDHGLRSTMALWVFDDGRDRAHAAAVTASGGRHVHHPPHPHQDRSVRDRKRRAGLEDGMRSAHDPAKGLHFGKALALPRGARIHLV